MMGQGRSSTDSFWLDEAIWMQECIVVENMFFAFAIWLVLTTNLKYFNVQLAWLQLRHSGSPLA